MMGLDSIGLAVLVSAAFATSILSAIVGMAGGITLLTVMLLFYEPLIAIPLHGVVQLASNSSRTWIQRKHVHWDLILRYAMLLLPMGYVGIMLARELPPVATRIAIGVFVLLATWAPGLLLLGSHPEGSSSRRRFFYLGGVVGFLNPTIGATGPLIAPFFLNMGLTRFAIIGTKAASQMLGHIAKVILFGLTGFYFADHALLLLTLSLTVVVGSWVGSRLLHSVNEVWFTRLYRGVLTLIALHLIFNSVGSEGVDRTATRPPPTHSRSLQTDSMQASVSPWTHDP